MGTVLVVTSGKGGVGKTTSTAALGAALAIERRTGGGGRFRRRPPQSRPRARRRAPRGVRLHQRRPGPGQALPGADPRQAAGDALPPPRLADPRQGRPHRGRRRLRHRFAPRGVRLGDLRQPGRHRARRAARHAPRRPRGRRHQPRSLLGPRLGPHHRPPRFAHARRRARRDDREACADHPLRPGARRPRRDAVDRGRARDPVAAAHRHHPREPGGAEGLQCRLADHARRSAERLGQAPTWTRRGGSAATASR